MAEGEIYGATYSGVPVYETVIHNVAVMRRRADSYMNATQILKVAGIEKGRRTKILEREIQTGEHEKVQGGYGKFQGTWIPLEKSRELAQRYGVLELLSRIMDFTPPAGDGMNNDENLPTKDQALAAQKRLAQSSSSRHESHHHTRQSRASPRIPSSPYTTATSTITRSPAASPSSSTRQLTPSRRAAPSQDEPSARKKIKTTPSPPSSNLPAEPTPTPSETSEDHRALLMAIFLSDDPEQVPEILQSTSPVGFDINMAIDDQGNTALHWACVLARVTIMQLLLAKGADPNVVNDAGETPLMRSVMVTNAFDSNYFPAILNALHSTIAVVDHKNRTVLHHAALTGGIPDRLNAAIYYMHHILHYISQHPATSSVLDIQDDQGNTAMTLAAQLECNEMVRLLTQAGAKPLENKAGLTTEDYLSQENAREPNDTRQGGERASTPTTSSTQQPTKRSFGPSERGREIVATVQKIVDALDDEYGAQLNEREQELKQLQEELDRVTNQLEQTRKQLEEQQTQSQHLVEAQQKVRNLEQAIQSEWNTLATVLGRQDADITAAIEELNNNEEDIDALFAVNSETDGVQEGQLRRKNRLLQSRLTAYTKNNEYLRSQVEGLRAQSVEKELQCKRLIAACCNLPVDKIDDLVEPLTQAIESDPPDLDLARVIGFMEKIRRQGAFTDRPNYPSSSSSSSPSSHNNLATLSVSNNPTPDPATNADTNDHSQSAAAPLL